RHTRAGRWVERRLSVLYFPFPEATPATAFLDDGALKGVSSISETKKPPGKVVFRRFRKPASF
ncbi:hypothetical protein, partial [Klebsiella quasipneumoniae]